MAKEMQLKYLDMEQHRCKEKDHGTRRMTKDEVRTLSGEKENERDTKIKKKKSYSVAELDRRYLFTCC